MHEAFSCQHHQVEKIPDNSQEANNRQYYSIGQFSQIFCPCIVECLQKTDGEVNNGRLWLHARLLIRFCLELSLAEAEAWLWNEEEFAASHYSFTQILPVVRIALSCQQQMHLFQLQSYISIHCIEELILDTHLTFGNVRWREVWSPYFCAENLGVIERI